MRRKLLVLACSIAMSACVPSFDLDQGVNVTCDALDDCPAGMRCVIDVHQCVSSSSSDSTLPELVDVVVSPTSGGPTTRFTLTFMTSEPLIAVPAVSGALNGVNWPWQYVSLTDGAYVFEFIPGASAGDGVMQLSVRLIDQAGNANTPSAGSLTLDTTGPVISVSRVAVASLPQGQTDTVAGQDGATEPGAQVTVYTDELFDTELATLTANGAGGFEAMELGDNYTDMTGDGLVGQALFWLVATDALGNAGVPLPIVTDIAPPRLAITGIQRLESEWGELPEVWIDTRTFRADANATGRVVLLADTHLNAMPVVQVGSLNAPCQLATLSAAGGVFWCNFIPDPNEAEDMDLVVTANAITAGSQNVSFVVGDAVRYDFTSPGAPEEAFVTLQMQPTGTHDTLMLADGAVEPFATVIVYSVQNFIDLFGNFGCSYDVQATAEADALGAVVVDLGDNNVGLASVRQVDQAGNDPCKQCDPYGGCPASISISNDIQGPSVNLFTLTPEISNATTAYFSLLGRDTDSSQPQVQCQLDDQPVAACDDLVATNLTAGAHSLTYWATDTLQNASPEQHFDWLVLPSTKLNTSPRYGTLSKKSYVVDAGGAGHLFVGGSKLYHFAETSPGVFATELLLEEPVTNVMAAKSGNTLYVAMQRGNATKAYDVLLGTYADSSWTFEVVHRGLAPSGSMDLTLDTDGAPVVLVPRCRSLNAQNCAVNGPDYRDYEVLLVKRVATGVWSTDIAENTHRAHEPRIVINADGDVWLFYREEASNGSKSLWIQTRQDGAWQTPVAVGGAGAPSVSSSLFQVNPGIALGPGGLPSVTYTPNNGVIWSALYDGATFSFHNTGRSGAYFSMPDVTGALWYVFDSYVVNRTTGGAWSGNSMSGVSGASSGQLITTGSFASAVFHLATQETIGANSSFARVVHSGTAATTDVAPADGYLGFAHVRGSESVVLASPGQMVTRNFVAGEWQAPTLVRASLGERGFSPSAVSGGGETWIAHGSLADSMNGSLRVVVEHDSGAGFATVGAVSADNVTSASPKISLLSNNAPVIAYVQTNGTPQIFVTWWTGSAFATPTSVLTLTAGYQVSTLALVGDAGGGSSMLAFGDTVNNSVRVITFNIASEDPGECESCNIESLVGANQAFVSASKSPQGRPQVMVSASDTGLLLFTYDSGWTSRDVQSELVEQTISPTGGWQDAAQNCFEWGGRPYGPVSFAYDQSDKLRVHGRFGCYGFGNDDTEVLAIEGAETFAAYPLATASSGYMDFEHAVFVDSSNQTTVVWGDPGQGVVFGFSEPDL